MTAIKRAIRAVRRGRGSTRAAGIASKLTLGALTAVFSLAPQAAAQGCALWYQSAAGSGSHSVVALQHGILLLLIPSVGLFAGIFGLIYSRRNASR